MKILVGVDFSESATHALREARQLAERMSADLHIAHFEPYRLSAAADLPVTTDQAQIPESLKPAHESLERLISLRAMLRATVPTEIHLRLGEPVAGLLALIKEMRPTLVIVGSHGRGPVLRALLGSVSDRLCRCSPVPVLVVPAPGRAMRLDEVKPLTAIKFAQRSVGRSHEEALPYTQTNDPGSLTFNIAPAGVQDVDVNPELRVRY